MARREDVYTAIWEDEDFDGLSDDAAFLYLWSFTNYRCGMSGLYQVKARSICEGRMTPARREAALAELSEKRFVFYVDGWMWVRSRVKHLRSKGPTIITSIVSGVKALPESHPLRAAFLSEYLRNSWVSKGLQEAEFEDPSRGSLGPHQGVHGNGSGTGKGKDGVRGSGGKGKQTDPDSLPVDAASEFVAIAERVRPILQRTAEARGAKAVAILPLLRAVEQFPKRDHVAVAGNVEHWLLHGNGAKVSAKDVVGRYRRFLESSEDVIKPVSSSNPSKYDGVEKRIQV